MFLEEMFCLGKEGRMLVFKKGRKITKKKRIKLIFENLFVVQPNGKNLDTFVGINSSYLDR